jgi:hypothetical protein
MWAAEIDGALILVLPFFDVPGGAEARASFLVGASVEDTLPWKALDGFAAKDYAHNDLKWHHVGTLTSPTNKRTRSTNDQKSISTTEAFLLDLGNITKNDDLLKLEKRTAWARMQFDKMEALVCSPGSIDGSMTPSLIENERELSGMHDRVKESLKEWDLVMRRRSKFLPNFKTDR